MEDPMAQGGRSAAPSSLPQPLHAKACAGGGHGSHLLDQHHTWCPQVPLCAPGRVCPSTQPLPFRPGAGKCCSGWAMWLRASCEEPRTLLQEQHREVWSCTARKAPSPRLPAVTLCRGSTRAWRARRAKGCMGEHQLRMEGAASQTDPEHAQLPSERGAQPGPVSCSITHLLLWMPFRQTTVAPVLTCLYCRAALSCLLLGDAGWVTASDGRGGSMWGRTDLPRGESR